MKDKKNDNKQLGSLIQNKTIAMTSAATDAIDMCNNRVCHSEIRDQLYITLNALKDLMGKVFKGDSK